MSLPNKLTLKPKASYYEVEVGQFWTPDQAERNYRILKVLAVDGVYAKVYNLHNSRTTTILISRMVPGPEGYRLMYPLPRRQ